MLSNEEIAYLQNNELFVPDVNRQPDPNVKEWIENKGFVAYAIGYKIVADRLIRSVFNDPTYTDLVMFPIIFLYRQYLELRLKQLILDGSLLVGKEPILYTTHKIDVLWRECKPILKKIELNQSKTQLSAVEKHVMLFANIDPESFTFRYPEDKNRQPNLPSQWEVDIQAFGAVMNILSRYLDVAATQLSRHPDIDEIVDLTSFVFELEPTDEE